MIEPDIPELYTYRELDTEEQLKIHIYLINCVRANYYFNIHMQNDIRSFNLVKIKSINFEHEESAIYVVFEMVNEEIVEIPIHFLSRIEIAGKKEI